MRSFAADPLALEDAVECFRLVEEAAGVAFCFVDFVPVLLEGAALCSSVCVVFHSEEESVAGSLLAKAVDGRSSIDRSELAAMVPIRKREYDPLINRTSMGIA
ncbi:hypothetical protein [Methylacidimicrobium tartarophylax]|uniref:hypothetical protein n=1 Tax=Methylacidimicrobium tartarophylax TaxID=1041768 RepID=UPI001159A691|nr:hypothetical protein [Methylacidimicrobium tartarophylax]